MFVGVVVENFHKCRESQEKEERARRAAKRAKKLEKRRQSNSDLSPEEKGPRKPRVQIEMGLYTSAMEFLHSADFLFFSPVFIKSDPHWIPCLKEIFEIILKLFDFLFEIIWLFFLNYLTFILKLFDFHFEIISVHSKVCDEILKCFIYIFQECFPFDWNLYFNNEYTVLVCGLPKTSFRIFKIGFNYLWWW